MDKELWKKISDKVLRYTTVQQKILCTLIDLAIHDHVFVDAIFIFKKINHSKVSVYPALARFKKENILLPEGRKGVCKFNNEKWEYLEKVYYQQQEMEEKQIG